MFISYGKIKKLNPKIDEEEEIKIGKKGITPNLLKSLDELTKKKKAIKLRILRNCPLSFDEIKNTIEKNPNLIVTQNRGRTFIVVNSLFISQNFIKKRKT